MLRTTRPLDEFDQFFEAYRVDAPVPADLWEGAAEDGARDPAPLDA